MEKCRSNRLKISRQVTPAGRVIRLDWKEAESKRATVAPRLCWQSKVLPQRRRRTRRIANRRTTDPLATAEILGPRRRCHHDSVMAVVTVVVAGRDSQPWSWPREAPDTEARAEVPCQKRRRSCCYADLLTTITTMVTPTTAIKQRRAAADEWQARSHHRRNRSIPSAL
jgi:hypothetical protein